MNVISRYSVLWLILLNLSCNDEEDRFERITKLRGLGLVTSPVVATPSSEGSVSTVQFTFYAAVPLGETVTAKVFDDSQGSLRRVSIANFQIGDVTYEDHTSLRLVKVSATGVVPPASVIYFDPFTGFATARYALSLTSPSGTQNMVGNIVVYPIGASELSSKNNLPQIAITAPTKDGTIDASSQEIKAELTEVNNETFRVGWFVSGGKLDAKNKLSAKWQAGGSGKYTVIVTARGTKTSAFAIDVGDVTAN